MKVKIEVVDIFFEVFAGDNPIYIMEKVDNEDISAEEIFEVPEGFYNEYLAISEKFWGIQLKISDLLKTKKRNS